MSASEALPQVSKRARILKRTVVGSTLAAAVVAVLLLAATSESGWIVLGTGLLLSALCCFELARMGSFARQGWSWVLAPCWLLVAVFGHHSVRHAEHLRAAGDSDLERHFSTYFDYEPHLLLELACVALLACALRGLLDVLKTRGIMARGAALVIVALVGLWSWSFFDVADPQDWDTLTYAVPLAAAALVAVITQLAQAREHLTRLVRAAWIAPLLVLPLTWMWHVWQRFDHGGLVALIVLAKVGDIAGYYVGSALGRHHPFPHVSPGKTVEGCLGSLAAGTVVGGALVLLGLLPGGALGIAGGLLAGAATNVAAQAGDLAESWIKRRAGVKDAGTWFGPSGGVLDLVDSLLFAVPAALLFWPGLLA